jgi:beta-N-acetylhexosaminidase
VAADQEGGNVQTLRGPGFAVLPTAQAQGALPQPQLAGLADGLGGALKTAGVNLDLAPVADVVPAGTEQANPPIGAFARQYGSTADVVVAAAGTIVGGLAAHGVTSTLKHFPGLGRVQQNTDTSANVVDRTTTAGDAQVTAFGHLAASPGRPFVMVSSATYTQIDATTQAVFSPVVLTNLLRGQLRFAGPIITDDIGNAKAVQAVPAGERAVRFFAAGGTLVLTVDASLVPGMIDAVLARSAGDPAFAAQVDAALHTALLAKAEAGLLGG